MSAPRPPRTVKTFLIGHNPDLNTAVMDVFRPENGVNLMSLVGYDQVRHQQGSTVFQFSAQAAQSKLGKIVPNYYRGADALLICPTDLTDLRQIVANLELREGAAYFILSDNIANSDRAEFQGFHFIAQPTAETRNQFLTTLNSRIPTPGLFAPQPVASTQVATVSSASVLLASQANEESMKP